MMQGVISYEYRLDQICWANYWTARMAKENRLQKET